MSGDKGLIARLKRLSDPRQEPGPLDQGQFLEPRPYGAGFPAKLGGDGAHAFARLMAAAQIPLLALGPGRIGLAVALPQGRHVVALGRAGLGGLSFRRPPAAGLQNCLLYTSDAADDL